MIEKIDVKFGNRSLILYRAVGLEFQRVFCQDRTFSTTKKYLSEQRSLLTMYTELDSSRPIWEKFQKFGRDEKALKLNKLLNYIILN